MKLRFTVPAEAALASAIDYLYDRNPAAALRFADEVERAYELPTSNDRYEGVTILGEDGRAARASPRWKARGVSPKARVESGGVAQLGEKRLRRAWIVPIARQSPLDVPRNHDARRGLVAGHR